MSAARARLFSLPLLQRVTLGQGPLLNIMYEFVWKITAISIVRFITNLKSYLLRGEIAFMHNGDILVHLGQETEETFIAFSPERTFALSFRVTGHLEWVDPIRRKSGYCIHYVTLAEGEVPLFQPLTVRASQGTHFKGTAFNTKGAPLTPSSSADYEFAVFQANPKNSFVSQNKLVIKPTILDDLHVLTGSLDLEGCTGTPGTRECGFQAFSYNILPPVASARINTRNSFSFRYGIVEVKAKLPVGDWLVPELWLEPKNHPYGPNYASGRIRLAMCRGNKNLQCNGQDFGSNHLESGVVMGPANDVRSRSISSTVPDNWHDYFHTYTLYWTPDSISFKTDNELPQEIVSSGGRLCEIIGFSSNTCTLWGSGSNIAPFDTDFYLSLGLSSGNARDFPDDCVNGAQTKPWKNLQKECEGNKIQDRIVSSMSSVLGGTTLGNLQRVLIHQKRAIRILASLRTRESCRQAFQELKILTVVNLNIQEAVTYVHLKSPDEVMTGAQQYDYNTRHAANYHLPAHRLASTEKNPTTTFLMLAVVSRSVLHEHLSGKRNNSFPLIFVKICQYEVYFRARLDDSSVSARCCALLNFWQDKANWSSTWNDEKSTLTVEYIRVTAL
ncbi:Hydrolase activity protein [Homalodisca vitripennis]|nr:Hydrolase activity protein [Homalodisca vitripennis]